MRTYPVSSIARTFAVAVLVASLAACGGRDEIKQGTTEVNAAAPTQYDLTLRADKDGQFDFDGATLTAEDLRSHIRFRNEPGHQPVKTILLKPGEKENIKNVHVATIASICRDMKITGYVEDNDHHLKIIQVVD